VLAKRRHERLAGASSAQNDHVLSRHAASSSD
jgi:hypothetical protein